MGHVSPVSTALRLGRLGPRRGCRVESLVVLGKGCFALAGVAPINDRDVQSSQNIPERIQGVPNPGDLELENDFNFQPCSRTFSLDIRHGEHGPVRRFLAHHDVRAWGIVGKALFNVRVSHLNVEEAFLETTGPKKRT